MPTPIPSEYRYFSRKKHDFSMLYLGVLLFSLHWALVAYINSSLLEQFVSETTIGLLYTVGSLVTIVSFLCIAQLLRSIGSYRFTIVLSILELISLLGIALSDNAGMAVSFFLLHHAIVPLIFFNMDVYMESLIGKEEGSTGVRRGLFLTIMSFAIGIAPLMSGFIVGSGTPQFGYVYLASSVFLMGFFLIFITSFKSFEQPVYSLTRVSSALRCFLAEKDVRNVFGAHLLLQFFFSWMVIYTPIYLFTHIGFNWQEIGLILFVGLMAYVVLEYPIGYIADRWLGEKEMMALGFVIMAVATSWFTFITEASVIIWMIAMFMTRVGASLVETTTESYFFKHTVDGDTNVISFFRMTRPIAYVLGAVIGSIVLWFLPFNLIFVILGLLLIPGLFFTMALRDTK